MKKAQLRIQEMVFMLVAVIFFFMLAGLFAFSIIYSNLQDRATNLLELKTISAISNLANTPEFSCVGSKTNCVDSDKIVALSENKDYRGFWPFTNLRIIKLSAFEKNEEEMEECNLFNYFIKFKQS